MPSNQPSHPTSTDAEAEARRSPFPRYERVSERLAEGPPEPSDEPREVEIPRTESYGELWRRSQIRRLRNR